MLAGELNAVLDGVEAAFPLTAWRHGDLAIWPLARIGLMATGFSWTAPEAVPTRGAIARHRLATVARMVSAAASATRDPQCAPAGALYRPCDMLLLSDGVSLIDLNGRGYERCCGPFVDLADDLGASSLLLMPRPHAGRMAQRWRPIALQLAAAVALRRQQRSVLPDYDAAMAWIAARGLHPLPRASLIARAERVLAWRSWFVRLLRRTRPRVVGMTSFYEPVQMALVAACRRLGITCFDIQHGMIGRLHGAYNGWSCAPAGGWELLPDLVWSWSEEDAPGVGDWAPRGSHAAVPGGNLLLDRFLARDEPQLQACVEAAQGLLPQARRRILVTLQPGLDDASYYALLQRVVAQAPPDWGFLIRKHPGHQPAAIARLGALFPGARCELERSSRLPLYAVLEAADVHLTHCSSVVLEAAACGLGSVVFDHLGREAYGHLACVRHATGTDEIVAALAGFPGRRRHGTEQHPRERVRLARSMLSTLLSGRRP